MNELSLFSGAGGGLLGTKWLLGWRTIGYVEIEPYCQEILKARIADGYLDAAPIFGDIRAFIRDGYADAYRGMVDVVTAGFPCQPFSVAGKRAGDRDDRNLWPETIEVIRRVGPRYVLLENVPGLLAHEYFGTVLGQLAESGFDCRWDCIPASACGAPHRRDRLWIVGHAGGVGLPRFNGGWPGKEPSDRCKTMADADRPEAPRYGEHGGKAFPEPEAKEPGAGGPLVADPQGLPFGAGFRPDESPREWGRRLGDSGRQVPEPGPPMLEERDGMEGERTRPATGSGCRWPAEPDVGRVAHGVASRVDRLKAIGNGQVPRVVKRAWEVLK